jgi:hypothetical protein
MMQLHLIQLRITGGNESETRPIMLPESYRDQANDPGYCCSPSTYLIIHSVIEVSMA